MTNETNIVEILNEAARSVDQLYRDFHQATNRVQEMIDQFDAIAGIAGRMRDLNPGSDTDKAALAIRRLAADSATPAAVHAGLPESYKTAFGLPDDPAAGV